MAGTNDTITAVAGEKLSGQDLEKLMVDLGMSAEHVINRSKDLGIEIGDGAYEVMNASMAPAPAAPAPAAPAPTPAPAPAPQPAAPPPNQPAPMPQQPPMSTAPMQPLPGTPGSTPIGSVNPDGTPKQPYTPDLDSFYSGTATGPVMGPINPASTAYQYSPGGDSHQAENNGGDRHEADSSEKPEETYTPIDSSEEWMKYLDDAEARKEDVDPYYWDPERYASTRTYTATGQPVAGSIFS